MMPIYEGVIILFRMQFRINLNECAFQISRIAYIALHTPKTYGKIVILKLMKVTA